MVDELVSNQSKLEQQLKQIKVRNLNSPSSMFSQPFNTPTRANLAQNDRSQEMELFM